MIDTLTTSTYKVKDEGTDHEFNLNFQNGVLVEKEVSKCKCGNVHLFNTYPFDNSVVLRGIPNTEKFGINDKVCVNIKTGNLFTWSLPYDSSNEKGY